MKMRIQGNVIRFRLNRREVNDFETLGRVDASIEFPGGGRLNYSVEKGGGPGIDAAFLAGGIRVRVPESMAHDWTTSDQVGIHERQPVASGQELEIVIEKDFQCMHKGDEGKDPEAYPNPMAVETS